MKKIVIIGLSLTLAVALIATIAMGWGPGFGPCLAGGPRFGFAGPLFANLTPEQSSQIQALRDAYLKEIEPLQQQLLAKGRELRSIWSTPNPDPTAVTAKQKEIFDLRTQLQEKANNLRLAIQKVVPSDQWPSFGPPAGFGRGAGFGPGPGFGPGRGFGPGFGAFGNQ
jgi:Spy/CpxP family protein refolding chaperone